MDEKGLIKKQLIKNMIATLIAFSIIFTTFSAIIYNQVKTTLYQGIDRELMMYINVNKDRNIKQENVNEIPRERFNPRIIHIVRNSDGQIINSENIGKTYSDYLSNISFNSNKLNEIYDLLVDGEYYYRTIIIKQGDIYIQLLASVDAEQQVLNHFGAILAFSALIAILISILASYVLSKRTIHPIVESWKKQTEFVQNASHELRTPLTIVQSKLEILLQNPQTKIIDNTEDIRISLNETKRLTKLIKDLMTLARADSKNYNIDKQEADIDGVISEIVVPYKEFAELDEKNFVLDLNYKKSLNIDISKISQLMIILLDNAIKYTEKGESIEVHTFEKEGKCVIEVKDTGIGIDDESLKHIFDRFYRADKARSRETGGTGLGLSIANWIVSVHGGTIKAEHNTPKGTIFKIKF